jgi:hypothetical protein
LCGAYITSVEREIMANILIDLFGDSEEEPKEKKAADPKPEAREDRLLRKQVINIDGEVIDDPYA